jgi:DNA polymerase III delta subunit
MELLNSEVIKLSAYLKANGRKTLTKEDVELVSPASAESDAFAIQNAIIEGNAPKAFRALMDMKARRTEPQIIIAMLAKTYSTLSSVSLLADEGERADEIQKTTGLSSYPLQLYLRAAKKLGTKKISEALRALLEADAASKQGGIAGYQAIEIFITQNI